MNTPTEGAPVLDFLDALTLVIAWACGIAAALLFLACAVWYWRDRHHFDDRHLADHYTDEPPPRPVAEWLTDALHQHERALALYPDLDRHEWQAHPDTLAELFTTRSEELGTDLFPHPGDRRELFGMRLAANRHLPAGRLVLVDLDALDRMRAKVPDAQPWPSALGIPTYTSPPGCPKGPPSSSRPTRDRPGPNAEEPPPKRGPLTA